MNHTFFAFAMQHFSLIDLKTFRAVADEGNLTRGAARVHLSPSTVCARIKGLESSLGVPLFTRSAQGMAVTPAGEIVRQGALRIERDIDGMLRDLEPFVSREAGTLRIVSNYGAAMNFLADGLARFLKAHLTFRSLTIAVLHATWSRPLPKTEPTSAWAPSLATIRALLS